jgi:hypothetical protein
MLAARERFFFLIDTPFTCTTLNTFLFLAIIRIVLPVFLTSVE